MCATSASVERSTVAEVFILKMNLLFMCFKHRAEYIFITASLLLRCNNRIMNNVVFITDESDLKKKNN